MLRRTALAAAFLLPLTALGLLIAIHSKVAAPHNPGQQTTKNIYLDEGYTPMPVSVPDLHQSPPGGLTRQDIRFGAIPLMAVPAFETPLEATADAGRIRIIDTSKRTTIWSGPISAAAFLAQTRGGVHTLSAPHGKVLWTDVHTLSSPDLLLQETSEGTASLIGNGGRVLWAGNVDVKTAQRDVRVSSVPLHAAGTGLKIDGQGRSFRLTDDAGRVLFSGQLPPHPTVLVKDGDRFEIISPGRVGTDIDKDIRVHFRAMNGRVSIFDGHQRALGMLPIPEVAVLTNTRYPGMPQSQQPEAQNWLIQYRPPSTMLKEIGTVTLAYHDPEGDLFRVIRVTRNHHSCQTVQINMPLVKAKLESS